MYTLNKMCNFKSNYLKTNKFKKWFLIEIIIMILIMFSFIIIGLTYIKPNIDHYKKICKYNEYINVKQNGTIFGLVPHGNECSIFSNYTTLDGYYTMCGYNVKSFNCSDYKKGTRISFWRNKKYTICSNNKYESGCGINSKYIPSKIKHMILLFIVFGCLLLIFSLVHFIVGIIIIDNYTNRIEKGYLFSTIYWAPFTYYLYILYEKLINTKKSDDIRKDSNENSNEYVNEFI